MIFISNIFIIPHNRILFVIFSDIELILRGINFTYLQEYVVAWIIITNKKHDFSLIKCFQISLYLKNT